MPVGSAKEFHGSACNDTASANREVFVPIANRASGHAGLLKPGLVRRVPMASAVQVA